MENYDVILDYFKKADKPVNAGLVASETGIERKEVDKVMKKLKEEEDSFHKTLLLGNK